MAMTGKSEQLISVRDFAESNGLLKQTVFKVLKRLEIKPTMSRGDNKNRGQMVSFISDEDSRRVLDALAKASQDNGEDSELPPAAFYDKGVFYMLWLEPDHDPQRFKVGFAVNLNERLRQLRCSAPYAQVKKTWPCRRLWEKTAIECVTSGCERLHTEVFRAPSLELVEEQCNKFFALMPVLDLKQA